MLYRIAALLVVLLWATMTALLVRSELFPESEAAWLRIPVDQVADHFFRQQEDSTLGIFQNKLQYGELTLLPRRTPEGNADLHGSGDLLIHGPLQSAQRVGFSFLIGMTPDYQARQILFRLTLRNPELAIRVESDPQTGIVRYEVSQGTEILRTDSGTLEELLQRSDLADLGIDPGTILEATSARRNTADAPPALTARNDSLRVLKDTVPTIRLSLEQPGGLEWSAHLSQTGRILRIDTPFAYTLLASGLEP